MAMWQTVHLWNIPPNAVCIGRDTDGDDIYVGRAHIEGELAPGKLIPNKGGCFVGINGREYKKTEFEVLVAIVGGAVGSVSWVPESKGRVPKKAIEGGYNDDGDVKFYVGRTFHEGTVVCGKIHPKYGVLYFPYRGQEHSSKKYDALVAM